jgi:O-antigen ligase
MNTLLTLSTALAFSWFGQLPPHGEFERDVLAFLLLSMVGLALGLRASRKPATSANIQPLNLGRPLVAFLVLWLFLVVFLVIQFVGMSPFAWGGRHVLTLFWLLGAAGAMLLGACAASEHAADAATRGTGERLSAWQAVAWGIVWAGLFNTLVAWIQVLPWPTLQALVPRPAEPGRGYGALLQPNLTATLLVLGLVSVASLLRSAGSASDLRTKTLWALALLLGSGVAVTGSRVGMVLLLILCSGLGAMGWFQRENRTAGRSERWLVLMPLAGFGIALLAVGLGVDFTTPLERSSALSNGRVLIFSNALDVGRAFPYFGAGFGQLSYWHVELPYQPKMPGYLTHAHNLVLQFWAELGAVGVVWLAVTLAVLSWPIWPWLKGQRVMFTASQQWGFAVLGLLLLHSLTEMPLWSAPFLLLFGFAAGLWLAPSAPTLRSLALPWDALVKYGSVSALVGVALCVWVYRDYLKVSALYDGARWAPYESAQVAERAGTSVFFLPTAEFAAANSAEVKSQTAEAYAKTLPILWRYVTDPRMFEWQLRTSAWTKNTDEFRHYALRFSQMYPEAYAEFRARVASEQSQSPWTDLTVVWP